MKEKAKLIDKEKLKKYEENEKTLLNHNSKTNAKFIREMNKEAYLGNKSY